MLSIRDAPLTVIWNLEPVKVNFKLSYSSRSNFMCKDHDFQCRDRRGCYNTEDICNDRFECFDHSDEENCRGCVFDRVPCSIRGHSCFHPITQRCDGVLNCPFGEDELTCSEPCNGTLRCGKSRGCFELVQKCDGRIDCPNGFDEINCIQECLRSNSFACNNGRCISRQLVDDGKDDCGDGSDEGTNMVTIFFLFLALIITATIFATLICKWLKKRPYLSRLLADPLPLSNGVFRGPAESETCTDTQFSESDYMRGGDIYEAYVESHQRISDTTERSRSGSRTVFERHHDSTAMALASLGLEPKSCIGLNRRALEEERMICGVPEDVWNLMFGCGDKKMELRVVSSSSTCDNSSERRTKSAGVPIRHNFRSSYRSSSCRQGDFRVFRS